MRSLFFLFVAAAMSHPLNAADGADLYAQNCAACHGDQGSGGIGVPLALASVRGLVSDDYLRKTIRNGRPGRVMPAFAALSDAEVDAIVEHLRSWGTAPPPRYSAAASGGDIAKGRQLFAAHCASCHGANGEGGKGTGVTLSRPRDLPIMPPALHNPGFLASASDQMIKTILMNGVKGTPMVSFIEKGLSETQIDDIVAFVRNFQSEPLSGSATVLAADQPVIVMESPYDLPTTVARVKQAIGGNNFVFIREQKLDGGLVPSGQEDPRRHIVYFCNFGLLSEALRTDPRVGLFLPCRITVVEQGGKVSMMAANPKRLSRLFNNSELNRMCDEMTRMYRTIMDDATL
jgi:cytochrome c oxidase cbb3-type subunit 3